MFSFSAAVGGLLSVSDTFIPSSQILTKSYSESVCQECAEKGSNKYKLKVGYKLQGDRFTIAANGPCGYLLQVNSKWTGNLVQEAMGSTVSV